MKLHNRPIALSDRGIRFTLLRERSDVPWGQFDRLQRAELDQARREGWRSIVDHVLIEWGRHPESIEDDGIEPPTGAAVAGASEVACRLRDEGMPLPVNVAPTGDGGIAFQYELSDLFVTIEVDVAGDVELRIFHDGRVIRRSLGRSN